MASRKEEKERLRQERLDAERQAQSAGRKRIMIGYAVAGVLALLIAVGLVIALTGGSDSGSDSGSAEASGDNVNTEFGGKVPAGIRVDDRVGTPPPEVQTGDLTAAAKAAGCDLQLNLKDEGSTHLDPETDDLPDYGLEHGRVIIQYSPDLSEQDQLALKGVFDADRPGVDLFPNPDMPYEVATTAWTQLMGCEKFEGDATLDAIRDFRDAYRGRGPEAIPF